MKKVSIATVSGHDLVCTLHPFPDLELLQGLTYHVEQFKINDNSRGCEMLEQAGKSIEGLRLAYNKLHKRWWLYYYNGNVTGGFDTKQKAIEWFTTGGL